MNDRMIHLKTTLILFIGCFAGNLLGLFLEPPESKRAWLVRSIFGVVAAIFLGQLVGYLLIHFLRVEDPAVQASTIASAGFFIGTLVSQIVNYFLKFR